MDRPEASLPAVGVTGVGVAAIRAAESSRPDRLFDDPYAARFASAAGWEGLHLAVGRTESLSAWIAVRTRFLDEVVLDACGAGCRQVVILGAGLDARAFRLEWPPNTRVWELDLAAVQEFKQRVVQDEGWSTTCDRRGLAVDLADDWGSRLVGAGLDKAQPVVWVAEGLLAYLTRDVGDRVLSMAAELSVPGSRMGLTLASPERLRAWREAHSDGRALPRDYVALWQSARPENPERWLASLGWQSVLYRPAKRSAAYGRVLGGIGGDIAGAGLVDAIRR
jgi:methyltransferase (TIGR00027 family)